ncbi:MAG: methylenetetrahydrofolate reductase [Actinomycetota bacterium]|jgi:methylenetetrahydrofolate reductase (NADPH)|nr:methylenetetrahydrofolate reductase [Actinomycetota bacterium]
MAKVHELLAAGPTLSFEFWPPRNPERFRQTLDELTPLRPDFVSVTYGAAGSTRERTHDLVIDLLRAGSLLPVAHLCCAAHARRELVEMLSRYRAEGIDNVLALRGDPPLDHEGALSQGDLHYAAELVALVREVGDFSVGVAVHPEGHPDSKGLLETDLDHAAAKLRAADYAITQFFFSVEDYLRLVEGLAVRGVDKPVVPGIMPIDRFGQVSRMAEMSGATFPPDLAARLEAASEDPDEVCRIGIEVATELGQKLQAEDVPGLHFYTMNRSASALAVCANLGLGPST